MKSLLGRIGLRTAPSCAVRKLGEASLVLNRSGRRVSSSGIVGRFASVLVTLFVSGVAGATPFSVAGFGDALTRDTISGGDFDGSYLGHLGLASGEYFDGGGVADTSAQIETRLDLFLNVSMDTADFIVIMAGTVDAYDLGGPYNESTTLGNIEDMIDLVLAANLVPIIIAPPPVVFPCDTGNALTCDTVNSRLLSLAGALQTLAVIKGVEFIDAFGAFVNDPAFLESPGSPASLYLADGLFLQFPTGDALIGSLVLTAIPEPGSGALMTFGLLAIALRGRRCR